MCGFYTCVNSSIVASYKGDVRVWKKGFTGNASISGTEVDLAKRTFAKRLSNMKAVQGVVGGFLTVIGGIISTYDYACKRNPTIFGDSEYTSDMNMTNRKVKVKK